MKSKGIEEYRLINRRPALWAALGTLAGVCLSMLLSHTAMGVAAAAFGLGFLLLRERADGFSTAFFFMMLSLGSRFAFANIELGFEDSAFMRFIAGLRFDIEDAVYELFGNDAGIVKGLLLGDRYDMTAEIYEIYVNNGVAHLFAVSGLHVTILSAVVLRIFRFVKRWLRYLLVAAFLLVYVCLTGLSPSATRAAVMLLVVLLAKALEKRPDHLSAFCIALTVVLLLFPSSITRLSFLLSFGCIYGLLTFEPRLKSWLHLPDNKAFDLLVSGLAVNLAILPWCAYFFSGVSYTAVPITILILPLSSILIVSSFVAVLLQFALPWLAGVVALIPKGMIVCINFLLKTADIGLMPIKPPHLTAAALWFVGLFFLSPYYLPGRERIPYEGIIITALSAALWVLL
ncbi:MAG: ComEC/Rec2 family competence protein [Clostridia bacterium]|nr:ComEC/Rec2 family competence protein [Clostridia bacterium]